MKKTLIFLLMVLLSVVLIISCDDKIDDSGTDASVNHNYKIGDTGPADGIIFYDVDADNESGNADGLTSSECGWRYLEAGKADLEGTYKWGLMSAEKCGTGEKIGDGLDNTEMLSEKGSDYEAACAVYKKDIYNNGYTDWFLPSIDELKLMYTNLYKHDPSLGDFKGDNYWSSSEYNPNYAWFLVFSTGYQSANGKTDSRSVRPVRAF